MKLLSERLERLSEKFGMAYDDADTMREAAAVLRAVEGAVPKNWCDPLLTGPTAVIGKPPYGCPDIERLLLAIRGRLVPLDAAGSAEGVG